MTDFITYFNAIIITSKSNRLRRALLGSGGEALAG